MDVVLVLKYFYTFSINESYLKGWVKSLTKCLDPFLNCGIIVDGDLSGGVWGQLLSAYIYCSEVSR